ncbi:hypothetical protein HDU91_003614 [Kappamyces sp. JEL0680]|nr:hypothetical protein HDU91_003614 [Kappamyces sp. JEL0680]
MAPLTRRAAKEASPERLAADKPAPEPQPSSESKRQFRQFKSLFKPRTSYLDFETLMAEEHPMRGFFVLFWMSITVKMLITSYEYWKVAGVPLSLDLLYFMGKDGKMLFIADGAMILSLFTVVFYQWLINWKIIPLAAARTGQHIWQAAWFLGIISWAFAQNWAWTQSATFTLHTIAMLMKQHSYTSYNIELQYKLRRLKALQEREKKTNEALDEEELEEMLDIHAELTRGGEMFPKNQSLFNFFDYLLVPTLVYELGYPRTSRFRLWYFCERVFSTFAIVGFLYFIVEHQITPTVAKMPQVTFLDSVTDLLLPFMTIWILVFFLIFECICNAFAELTCFADREFYADWWNSTTYEEFARLWNKVGSFRPSRLQPVHHFLLRHCYKESIQNLNFSKKDATLLTFFLSSCMHELVFVVVLRKVRFYLFFMQMFQLPLIFLSKLEVFKGKPFAGNVFFWFGLFLGPPFLCVCYIREFYVGPCSSHTRFRGFKWLCTQ